MPLASRPIRPSPKPNDDRDRRDYGSRADRHGCDDWPCQPCDVPAYAGEDGIEEVTLEADNPEEEVEAMKPDLRSR